VASTTSCFIWNDFETNSREVDRATHSGVENFFTIMEQNILPCWQQDLWLNLQNKQDINELDIMWMQPHISSCDCFNVCSLMKLIGTLWYQQMWNKFWNEMWLLLFMCMPRCLKTMMTILQLSVTTSWTYLSISSGCLSCWVCSWWEANAATLFGTWTRYWRLEPMSL
jgi:hypothetical protein